jgi:hypothetical protein
VTATLHLEGLDNEELTTLDPRARCTPRLGATRILPTKTCKTSGLMRWHWKRTGGVIVDAALVQIGDRTWACTVDPPIVLAPGDGLELTASLADFG